MEPLSALEAVEEVEVFQTSNGSGEGPGWETARA
jgi:hypothetical protein